MKITFSSLCLLITLLTLSLLSCRKDGMHSTMAKRIQYRWERFSSSSRTDYLDGRPIASWSVMQLPPGHYYEFNDNAYCFFDGFKFQYKVDGDKILYLKAGNDRFTTPQYTDTLFIKEVNDHLLVLYNPSYHLSPGYSYINEYVDSLKR